MKWSPANNTSAFLNDIGQNRCNARLITIMMKRAMYNGVVVVDRETDLLAEERRHEGTIRKVVADEEVAPAHQTYTPDGTGS